MLLHYGVNCHLITTPPVPMFYSMHFGYLSCWPRCIIASTLPRNPLFIEQVFASGSSTHLRFLSQPLRCLYLDHFFPQCSEYLPVVQGAWVVNERAKRGNLLGSSPKLNRGGNSERLSVGPDPETTGGSRSLLENTICNFRWGPSCLENALGTSAPSC